MAWYDSNWQYRKAFITDHTVISGGPHTDIPLVVLHPADSDFYSKCQSDGDDLLFTAGDGTTKLDHEIEVFESTGYLVAWFRVPSLSGTVNQTFYLYYGNPSAANQENIAGVWSNDYQGVYHMATPSGSYSLDSTGNNYHLTINGTPTTSVSGYVGYAINFSGSSQYLEAASSSIHNYTGDMTISAWAKPDTTPDRHQPIVGKGDNQYMLRRGDSTAPGDNNLEFYTYDGGWEELQSTNPVTADQWNLLVGRKDGTTLDLFLNGLNEDTGTNGMNSSSDIFRIANEYGASSRYFEGTIDEVRISNVVRTDAWINVEYENMYDPVGFFSSALEEGVGEEEEGWSGGKVNSVNYPNIGKINSVLRSDIDKVNSI